MKWLAEDWMALGAAVVIIAIIGLVVAVLVMDKKPLTRTIDGCEYLQYFTGRQWMMMHKESCTNAVHRR